MNILRANVRHRACRGFGGDTKLLKTKDLDGVSWLSAIPLPTLGGTKGGGLTQFFFFKFSLISRAFNSTSKKQSGTKSGRV